MSRPAATRGEWLLKPVNSPNMQPASHDEVAICTMPGTHCHSPRQRLHTTRHARITGGAAHYSKRSHAGAQLACPAGTAHNTVPTPNSPPSLVSAHLACVRERWHRRAAAHLSLCLPARRAALPHARSEVAFSGSVWSFAAAAMQPLVVCA